MAVYGYLTSETRQRKCPACKRREREFPSRLSLTYLCAESLHSSEDAACEPYVHCLLLSSSTPPPLLLLLSSPSPSPPLHLDSHAHCLLPFSSSSPPPLHPASHSPSLPPLWQCGWASSGNSEWRSVLGES